MRMEKRIIAISILLVTLALLGKSSESAYGWEGATSRFQSPEGVLFQSDSPNWNEEKLKDLYHDLLLNGHGNELETLNSIIIYDRKDKIAAGRYLTEQKQIILYDGKHHKTVGSLSETLSHEYGHHFTYTYFPDLNSRNSEWGKLRDDKRYPINWNEKKGSKDHPWQPAEIFADDYVFFYGAQNQKPSGCTKEKLHECKEIAHENTYLTHPSIIKGMKEFLEEKTGVPTTSPDDLASPIIHNLKGEKSMIGGSTYYDPYIDLQLSSLDKRYWYKISVYKEENDSSVYYELEPKQKRSKQQVIGVNFLKGDQAINHASIMITMTDLKTRNVIHTSPMTFILQNLKTQRNIHTTNWYIDQKTP